MATPIQVPATAEVVKHVPARSEFATARVSADASLGGCSLEISLRKHPQLDDCHFLYLDGGSVTVSFDRRQLEALRDALGEYLSGEAQG